MSLNQNLSVISTVPKDMLDKLTNLSIACICDEALNQLDKDQLTLDLSFGTLIVNISENTLRYRFIPSNKLDQNLQQALLEGVNPLVNLLENSLTNKFTGLYKELL